MGSTDCGRLDFYAIYAEVIGASGLWPLPCFLTFIHSPVGLATFHQYFFSSIHFSLQPSRFSLVAVLLGIAHFLLS